jgi:hypothetical protein
MKDDFQLILRNKKSNVYHLVRGLKVMLIPFSASCFAIRGGGGGTVPTAEMAARAERSKWGNPEDLVT